MVKTVLISQRMINLKLDVKLENVLEAIIKELVRKMMSFGKGLQERILSHF